ncbi:hypothetical protein MHU86_2381 [Fragilaria crotonensis]|nr:hypothetical protein MHU86_2381 [Fragilaria crotonensis]
MGKKKSKIAKKIQATKKFGGLVVQKGGVKHHSDPLSKTPNVTAIASASTTRTALTATKHKHKLQRQLVKPTSSTIVNINNKNAKKKNNQDDFESQMKSLQERTAHLESNTRRGRSSRSTTASTPRHKPIIQLAPASFIIDDKLKSTDRLVQEATHKMELGWSSLDDNGTLAPPQQHQHLFAHATGNTSFSTTPSRTLQELAKPQQHRMAWTDESPLERTDDNPYAVLQQDDDDDEDDHDHINGQSRRDKPHKQNPLFQLAPPSFHFQSENDNGGDWDPDL